MQKAGYTWVNEGLIKYRQPWYLLLNQNIQSNQPIISAEEHLHIVNSCKKLFVPNKIKIDN